MISGTYKKSNLLGLVILLAITLTTVSCDDSSSEISVDDLASGLIGGEEWSFGGGTSFFEELDNRHVINLLSTEESAINDACSILFPGQAYARFIVPAALGNYSLPFSPSSSGVKFFEKGAGASEFLTATSGFVEVTGISSTEVRGNIQAVFDDSNTIEGVFVVIICN